MHDLGAKFCDIFPGAPMIILIIGMKQPALRKSLSNIPVA